MQRPALNKFDPSPAAFRWLIALALGGLVSSFLLMKVPASLLPSPYYTLLPTAALFAFLCLFAWLGDTPAGKIAFAPWRAIDERERAEQAWVYQVAYFWLARGLACVGLAVVVGDQVVGTLPIAGLVEASLGAKIRLGVDVLIGTLFITSLCVGGLPMMVSTRLMRPDDAEE